MHAWDDNVVEALPLRPWRSAPTGSPPSKRVSPVSRPRGVPRPTMRDVAKAAAVSLKTVSRVVNDEGGVRPETAARVHEAIVTLGFRRNDMARVLRQGRSSGTLGLVIEDVANPFYSDITRAVERVARSRGYLVIAGSSDEDPERERDLVRTLCERRVEGLLIVPAGDDHRFLLPDLHVGMAVVFMDRPPGGIQADTILIDNVDGARQATEHLLAHGRGRDGQQRAAWPVGPPDRDLRRQQPQHHRRAARDPGHRQPCRAHRVRRFRAGRHACHSCERGHPQPGEDGPPSGRAAVPAPGRRRGTTPTDPPTGQSGSARLWRGAAMRPIPLAPNRVRRFYRGGAAIASLTGSGPLDAGS